MAHWDTPDLVKDATLQWTIGIQNILNNAGFPQLWTRPTSVNQNEFIVELEQRLVDQYVQSWQAELSPEGLNGETSIVQSD